MSPRIVLALTLPVVLSAPAHADPEAGVAVRLVRLEGVRPEIGVYMSIETTEKQVRLEEKTRTRNVGGRELSQTIKVETIVDVPVVRRIDTESHVALDGNGKPITPEKVFQRVREGDLVFLGKTPTLPPEYLKLLSAEAIILAPKPTDEKPTADGPS